MLNRFVSHKTLANLLMFVFIALGISAIPVLRRETFPDFAPSKIQVAVPYPGASAEEVEEAICQKIEDAIDGVRFIKEIKSVAEESIGRVTVEIEDNASVTEVQSDIETEVNAIDDFPESAEDAVLTQLGMTDAVMTVAVTGPMSPGDLRDYCDDLKSRLKTQPMVSLVEIQGFSDRELRVDLNSAALRQFGLTASQVAETVATQSVDVPVGTIETKDNTLLVRFVEQRRTPRELEQIVISAKEGAAEILLGDVARVTDTFEDAEVQTWLDGKRAGILQIDKTRNQDTTKVAAVVRDYLDGERIRQPKLKIAITSDNSVLINDRLGLLLTNTWQGIVLVFITMWLFFNVKISFWVVMSLPVSFLGAFYLMPMAGQSINMMTMVAMLLAVGLLMDDGIVIAENIARHMAEGKSSMAAAVDGVREVAGGVLSSFLTTICVLGPLASLSGDIGAVLEVIPIVLLMVMSVSLIEAFLILPAHLGHSLHDDDPQRVGKFRQKVNAVVDWTRESLFGSIVDWSVRWRYLTAGICIAAFILSISLMAGGFVGYTAFPETEGDVVHARILLPQGTPLKKTENVARQVSDAMKRVNEKFNDQPGGKRLVESIMVQFNENKDAFEAGAHVATVTVQLLAPENRSTSVDDVLSTWRTECGQIVDVISLTFGEPAIGPAGRPIEVRFESEDLDQAKDAAQDALAWFARFEGVFDLNDDLRPGKREVRLRIKDGAFGLGLSVQSMANQLSTAFQGTTADDVQVGAAQYEINVRFDPENRDNLDDLLNFHFILSDGAQVPIQTVADINIDRGWSRIARVDSQRTVTLIGDIDPNVVNNSQLMSLFETEKIPQLQKDFPGVHCNLEGESAESADTQSSMLAAFALGLLGVYAILCYQFESWLEPVVVMFAIPMALIGVIWGHLLFGLDISMPSLVGFISLSGVVVNDSILLILFLKQGRDAGHDAEASAGQASRIRFRAIMLTSATTIAGLLPLTLERSSQAQTLIPLAVAIAFGMMASTVLILIVIPSVYVILCDLGLVKSDSDTVS